MLDDILSTAAAKTNEVAGDLTEALLPRDAIVYASSYDPLTGTITAIQGDSFSAFTEGGEVPLAHSGVGILTPAVGDQYGPIGDERVVLIPVQHGYVAAFLHGPDDTPKAPAGERWLVLRHAQTKAVLGTLKLTQSGAQALDGGGGFRWDGGTRTEVLTAGGAGHVADDHAQSYLVGANGQVYTLYDGAGNAVSHVVPTGGLVGLGATASTLGAARAAITNADAQTLASNIMSQTLQSLMSQLSAAMVTASSAGSIPAFATSVQTAVTATNWVVNKVTAPTIPSGSSKVRIAT